jgi:hypothetical protein
MQHDWSRCRGFLLQVACRLEVQKNFLRKSKYFEGSKNFLEGKCNYCSQKNLQIAKEVFTKLADCIVLKRLALKQLL